MADAAAYNNVDIGAFLQILFGCSFLQPDSTGLTAGSGLAGDLSVLPRKENLRYNKLLNSKQNDEKFNHSIHCQSSVSGYSSSDI